MNGIKEAWSQMKKNRKRETLATLEAMTKGQKNTLMTCTGATVLLAMAGMASNIHAEWGRDAAHGAASLGTYALLVVLALTAGHAIVKRILSLTTLMALLLAVMTFSHVF